MTHNQDSRNFEACEAPINAFLRPCPETAKLDLVNVTEFASLHGMNRRRVYKLIRAGRIPSAVTVAGYVAIPRDAAILPPKS